MAIGALNRFGWHPDRPDPRDLTSVSRPVVALLAGLERPGRGGGEAVAQTLPPRVDWSEFFAPPGDQGALATSVPLACLGLAQYFERRAHGRRLDGSVRFLYKMARELQGWTGDAGATYRTTLKALVRFGLPPSALCPDAGGDVDRPLEPHLFAYGEVMRSMRYARLDTPWSSGGAIRARVRAWLAAGFPCAFGLVVFDSMTDDGDIACPTSFDDPTGGLALVATGYDDAYRIRSTRGALRVRNCWGASWGDNGYGWLPYEYIERGLATDFWTLLREDWLASGEFAHPGGEPR
jgi:C1A family cysteine protease